MTALEKLLLLKSIAFFKQTPDELLLHIATTASKEKHINSGDLIFKKGDKSLTMYIVVRGKISIHHNGILVKELGEREIFGELAALSFEARTASASALTDSFLLAISSRALYDLMNVDIGLAKGIIKALCERMQSMSSQLETLLRDTHVASR